MLNKAVDVTLSMNADDRMRELARVRLDSWLNEQTSKYAFKMEAKAEGIKEAQIQFVKKMLSKNYSLNEIAEVSDLPFDDIKKLQAGLNL
jgi:predicted transposase YdaD